MQTGHVVTLGGTEVAAIIYFYDVSSLSAVILQIMQHDSHLNK